MIRAWNRASVRLTRPEYLVAGIQIWPPAAKSGIVGVVGIQRLMYRKTQNIVTPEMSRDMTKPRKWLVRPAEIQISLGIRPVWSESSLSAWRKLGSLATHWSTAKTLTRLSGCPGWSESSLGAWSLCWFCHEAAQIIIAVIKHKSMHLKGENGMSNDVDPSFQNYWHNYSLLSTIL